MVPKDLPHPDDTDKSTAKGGIASGSGAPGQPFVPPREDSPTAVDIGFNPGSNTDSSPSDSPTLIDFDNPRGTPPAGEVAQSRNSGSRAAQFVLIPGMLLTGRYEILEVLGEGGMLEPAEAARNLRRLAAMRSCLLRSPARPTA